jgi:hypothetical protein
MSDWFTNVAAGAMPTALRGHVNRARIDRNDRLNAIASLLGVYMLTQCREHGTQDRFNTTALKQMPGLDVQIAIHQRGR